MATEGNFVVGSCCEAPCWSAQKLVMSRALHVAAGIQQVCLDDHDPLDGKVGI